MSLLHVGGGGEQSRALADDHGIGEQDDLVDELVVEQPADNATRIPAALRGSAPILLVGWWRALG
jgi:hypothetical protein